MNLRKNIWHIVSNGGTIHTFTFNTMQSYQLSDLDEKDIVFSPPRKSGNGFMIKCFLRKEGENVPLLIQGPAPVDEKQDVPANWCLCFGFKTWENTDKRKPSNHTTGIVIRRVDNSTAYQTQWIHDYKEKIVKTCATELVRIKDAIRKPNLTLTSDILTGSSFARLEEKSGDSILNLKVEEDTELLSYPNLGHIPLAEMFGKRSNVKFEARIDGIYVGPNSTTIQVKLDRVCVAQIQNRRLRAPMHVYVPDDEVEIPDLEEEEDDTGIPL